MKLSSEVIKIIDLGLESYAKDMYLEKLDFCENIHSEIVNSLKKLFGQKVEKYVDFLNLLFPEKMDKNRKLLTEIYMNSTFSDELNDIKIFEDYCSEVKKPCIISNSPLTKVFKCLIQITNNTSISFFSPFNIFKTNVQMTENSETMPILDKTDDLSTFIKSLTKYFYLDIDYLNIKFNIVSCDSELGKKSINFHRIFSDIQGKFIYK